MSQNLDCLSPNEVKDPNSFYDLKIVTIIDEPFIIKEEHSNQICYKGFLISLINKLANDIGFKYYIYEVPDGKYGSCKSDQLDCQEKWSGIMGQLVERKADLALSAMTITPLREKYVDFTYRYMDYSISLAMKNIKPGVDRFAILRPFSGQVWCSLFIAFFVISYLLFLVNHYVETQITTEKGRPVQRVHRVNDTTFFGTIWFLYSGTVRQGSEMSLITFSAKILTGIWWAFMLIVLSLYTATLLAYLTSEHLKKPVNSFKELISSGLNISYGTVSGTSFWDFLENAYNYDWISEDDKILYLTLFDIIKKDKNQIQTPNKGYEKVVASTAKNNFAFLWDTASVNYQILTDESCSLITFDDVMFEKGYGLALPHDVYIEMSMSNYRKAMRSMEHTRLRNSKF